MNPSQPIAGPTAGPLKLDPRGCGLFQQTDWHHWLLDEAGHYMVQVNSDSQEKVEALAAHIMRCVNAFPALVEALRELCLAAELSTCDSLTIDKGRQLIISLEQEAR